MHPLWYFQYAGCTSRLETASTRFNDVLRIVPVLDVFRRSIPRMLLDARFCTARTVISTQQFGPVSTAHSALDRDYEHVIAGPARDHGPRHDVGAEFSYQRLLPADTHNASTKKHDKRHAKPY